jgi:hypothetical protein
MFRDVTYLFRSRLPARHRFVRAAGELRMAGLVIGDHRVISDGQKTEQCCFAFSAPSF